jgi:hypothetical protein
MNGINTVISGALGSVSTELIALAPAAVGVAGVLWGIPKAVGFFKRVAK